MPDDLGIKDSVPYVARRFVHPALAGRSVVRLLPETLRPAEDLALATLGFEGSTTTAVGYGRTVAVGFPAWALINDPTNSSYALELVRELELAALKAKRVPGYAKEDLERLGQEIALKAPHFLPTFFEEAGRRYIRINNKLTAMKFFSMARAAERKHQLTVDEGRNRDVFLEFALSGALGVGTLSNEAQELPLRVGPAQAFSQFRDLAIQRVKGGLPPHTRMAKELKALAVGAGLDSAAEEETVVAELIDVPALLHAGKGFWVSYKTALKRAVKNHPRIQTQLFQMFPPNIDGVTWSGVLHASGVIDFAVSSNLDLLRWLEDAIAHHQGGWGRPKPNPLLLDAILRIGRALQPEHGRSAIAPQIIIEMSQDYDLEVVDALLEAKFQITITWLLRQEPLNISNYLRNKSMTRDMTHLASFPALMPLLFEGIIEELSEYAGKVPDLFENVAAEKDLAVLLAFPAIRILIRESLAEAVAFSDRSLASLGIALDHAEPFASATGLELCADLLAKLSPTTPETMLAEALNSGILDELVWEAFESRDSGLTDIVEAWPHLLAHNQTEASVISRDGLLLSHRLQYHRDFPSGTRHETTFDLVGDDLLCSWIYDDHAFKMAAYWASSPQTAFRVPSPTYRYRKYSLPSGTNSRTFGDRAFTAGTPRAPLFRLGHIFGDGYKFWLAPVRHWQWETEIKEWLTLDPQSGDLGSGPLPQFLADIADRPGHNILLTSSVVRPLPEEYSENPLGLQAETVGHCWFTDAEGLLWIERTDGVRAGGFKDGRLVDIAHGTSTLVSLPGGALVVSSRKYLIDAKTGAILTDANGRRSYRRESWPANLFGRFGHNFAPRDVATSLRMRSTKPEDLHGLISASKVLFEQQIPVGTAVPGITDLEKSEIERLFPDAAQPLVDAIVALSRDAARDAQISTRLRTIAAQHLSPDLAIDSPLTEQARIIDLTRAELIVDVSEKRIPDFFRDMTNKIYISPYSFESGPRENASPREILARIALVGAALGIPNDSPATPSSDPWPEVAGDWLEFLQSPAALLPLAMSPRSSEHDRLIVAALLEGFADSGLYDFGHDLEVVCVSAERSRKLHLGHTLRTATSRLVLAAQPLRAPTTTPQHDNFIALIVGTPQWQELGLEPIWSIPAGRAPLVPDLWREAARLLKITDAVPVGNGPAELAARSGMLLEEAKFLLAGLPPADVYYGKFSQGLLAQMNMSATEARIAAMAFQKVDRFTKKDLLAALVPDDVTQYFQAAPYINEAARILSSKAGLGTEISPETLRDASSDLRDTRDPIGMVRWICNADPSSTPPADSWYFDQIRACLWLANNLPSNHSARGLLGAKFRDIRSRFLKETTVDGLTMLGHDYSNSFRTAFGLPPKTSQHDSQNNAPVVTGRDSVGAVTADFDFHTDGYPFAFDRYYVDYSVATDLELDKLAGFAENSGFEYERRLARAIHSSVFLNYLDFAAKEAYPTPGNLHNPAISASSVVAEVSSTLDIGDNAATLFLQLLALPGPSDANVKKWNGWTQATHRAAGAELSQADLVIAAKRSRAGRSLFISSGWVNLKSPNLPMESEKAQTFDLEPGNDPFVPLVNVLILEPFSELFASAWQKYQARSYTSHGQKQEDAIHESAN